MASTNHPKIRPPRKTFDRIIELIAIVALLYGIVLVVQSWNTLPSEIPTHFDGKMNPDAKGPKGMILLLPAISIVLVPMMLLISRYPWLSNVPWKINEENAAQQYALIVRLLSLEACVVSLLFLTLLCDTISIAGGGTSLLGPWFLPVFMVGSIAPIIWYLIVGFRTR
ncbi:MAG: DUF1648 domain-containing protein [Planctomycetota bacterium]|nr:DUF1648 domain-containing protein [Planctomycetota bacterium]